MSLVSLAIGIIIGMLIAFTVMFGVFWWTDTHDGRNEKKYSENDFDEAFHRAWEAGVEYGKQLNEEDN